MPTIDEFFDNPNIAKDQSQLNFKVTNDYLEPIKAISRLYYSSIYVVDYFKQTFEYVSENPLFLCGNTPEEVKAMGFEYYLKNVPEREHDLLFKINNIGFDFYEKLKPEEVKNYSMSYDFHLITDEKETLINHRITPLFLSNDGKLWKALCLVSLSNGKSAGNIEILQHEENLVYRYDMEEECWQLEPKVNLSSREEEILHYSAQGFTVQEIAEIIHISPDTVKFHRRNLYEKLEVSNISEAIFYVLNKKIV